jgi:hypothetical protein
MKDTIRRFQDLIDSSSHLLSLTPRDTAKDFFVIMREPQDNDPIGFIMEEKDMEYLMGLDPEDIPRELTLYPDLSLLYRTILKERLAHGL